MTSLALLLGVLGVGGVAASYSQAEAWARDGIALKGSAASGTPFRVGTWGRPMGPSDSRIDTVPPYLAFPEPGLDDPAAYEGYRTRFYRDARGNTVQIYIDQKSGRVVNLWADALNESLGFTVRDSAADTAAVAVADTAAVAFGAGQATVGATGGR